MCNYSFRINIALDYRPFSIMTSLSRCPPLLILTTGYLKTLSELKILKEFLLTLPLVFLLLASTSFQNTEHGIFIYNHDTFVAFIFSAIVNVSLSIFLLS